MPKQIKFQTPKGMHDILPADQVYYQKIYDVVFEAANFYNFGKIDTPILEDTDLFSRSVGVATDIIKKEMYTLKTKGGDCLSLRPEGTAPIARAYIQHGMANISQPVKLWYFGPFFRYEKPQAGRYRQFWQFSFEVLGEKDGVIDAQIIQIIYDILQELKVRDLIVDINSIGCDQCRPYYKKLLTRYFKPRESYLCRDCKRRLKENVLRILDCKEEKCQAIIEEAPQSLNYLCDDCRSHFKSVIEFLDELEIPYNLNPYLVRGLDYYTKTVFEIFLQEKEEKGGLEKKEVEKGEERKEEGEEERKKKALAGGGRYDKLVSLLGGKDIPAAGGGVGVERLIEIIKTQDVKIQDKEKSQVFLAQLGQLAKRKSLKILREFRKNKIKVLEAFGKDSLKVQLNRAHNLGVKYTLILGQKEALENEIIIRDMETGKQEIVKIEKIVETIKNKLKKK